MSKTAPLASQPLRGDRAIPLLAVEHHGSVLWVFILQYKLCAFLEEHYVLVAHSSLPVEGLPC
jgi:hypothetical protein